MRFRPVQLAYRVMLADVVGKAKTLHGPPSEEVWQCSGRRDDRKGFPLFPTHLGVLQGSDTFFV